LDEGDAFFYSKASVKFPVLVDEAAIGANNRVPSNDKAYFTFDDNGQSADYLSPAVYFPIGGGSVTQPPAEEEKKTETEEEPSGPSGPDEETDESEQPAAPTVPPGTPVQPGTPDVPPVPYSPGGTLVPLDDGGFLEIDENGVPLGVWEYDEEEGAWIFDEEVPLALLPQTGDTMPAAGFAHLWILPLFALLWLGLIWPRLRRRMRARAK
jgi:hypothetical protein